MIRRRNRFVKIACLAALVLSARAHAADDRSLTLFECKRSPVRIVVSRNLDRRSFNLSVGMLTGMYQLHSVATRLIYLHKQAVYVGRIDQPNPLTQVGFQRGLQVTIKVTGNYQSKYTVIVKDETMLNDDRVVLQWDNLPCQQIIPNPP